MLAPVFFTYHHSTSKLPGVLPDLFHSFPRQGPGRGTWRLHLPPNFLEPNGIFLSFQGAGGENQWQKPCVRAKWVVEASRAKYPALFSLFSASEIERLEEPLRMPNFFFKRVMKYVTREGTDGPKGAEHLPLRLC